MLQLEGFIDENQPTWICRLLKSIYGLRQASRVWNKCFDTFLIGESLQACPNDKCLYFSKDPSPLLLAIFVDDGLVYSKSPKRIQTILTSMKGIFKVKIEDPEVYVGIHIIRSCEQRQVHIHQALYIKSKLQKYGMIDSAPCVIPADSTVYLSESSSITDDQSHEQYPYKEVHGSLGFASHTTRPDITFATSNIGHFQSNPLTQHYSAANKILKYLRGSVGYGITYGGEGSNLIIQAFCDSDFANDKKDRHSRSGYVVFLNNGPVIRGSHRQDILATSTCYAEYIALYNCAKQIIWLRRLMEQIGHRQQHATTIHCDNQACIRLAFNPDDLGKNKHVDLRFHYTRELIEDQHIQLQYCPSATNVSDIFTKGSSS